MVFLCITSMCLIQWQRQAMQSELHSCGACVAAGCYRCHKNAGKFPPTKPLLVQQNFCTWLVAVTASLLCLSFGLLPAAARCHSWFANRKGSMLFLVCVCWQGLTAPMQGFLNCIVYGWSRKSFREASGQRSLLLDSDEHDPLHRRRESRGSMRSLWQQRHKDIGMFIKCVLCSWSQKRIAWRAKQNKTQF